MRIRKDQYDYMKRAIEQLDIDRDLLAHAKQYERDGLTPKRFRWDSCYGAALTKWICDFVYRDGPDGDYNGTDDTHIDTALRKIMRDVGVVWASR